MTITLSPRYSRLRHSPALAISLSWQTTCGAARRNARFSASKNSGSWYSHPGRLMPSSGSGFGSTDFSRVAIMPALAILARLRQWRPRWVTAFAVALRI
jgi:hypothetical protein